MQTSNLLLLLIHLTIHLLILSRACVLSFMRTNNIYMYGMVTGP